MATLEMLCDPGKYYKAPLEILDDDRLSREQKISALESWKNQIEQARSDVVGKSAEQTSFESRRREVLRALDRLNGKDALDRLSDRS